MKVPLVPQVLWKWLSLRLRVIPFTLPSWTAVGRLLRRRGVRRLKRMAVFCLEALARTGVPMRHDAPKHRSANTHPARSTRPSLDQ
jgi:hypothetical protein